MSDKSESSQNASPARERTESVESPESPPPSDRSAEQRPTSTAQSIISTASEEGPTSSYGPSENDRMTTGDCEAENRRSQLMQVLATPTPPFRQSEIQPTVNRSPSDLEIRRNRGTSPPETQSQMSASSNVSGESLEEIVSVGVRTGMQSPSHQSSSHNYIEGSRFGQSTPLSAPVLEYVNTAFGHLDNVMADAYQNVADMMNQYGAPTYDRTQVIELDDEEPTRNVDATPSKTKQDTGDVNATDESESVSDESQKVSDDKESTSDEKELVSKKKKSTSSKVSDEHAPASDKSDSVADEDNSPIIEASSSEELFVVEDVDSDGEVHRTKQYRRKPADRRVRRVRSSSSSDDSPPPKKSKEDLSKKSRARVDQESSSGSSSESQVNDEESSPDAPSSSSSTSSWEAKRRKRRLQESSSSQSPLSDD